MLELVITYRDGNQRRLRLPDDEPLPDLGPLYNGLTSGVAVKVLVLDEHGRKVTHVLHESTFRVVIEHRYSGSR